MINFIKSLFLKRELKREVKDIEKIDNKELQLLNVHMRGLEEKYTKYYNMILTCPYYTFKYKKDTYEDLKSLINIMNNFRYENNYNFT